MIALPSDFFSPAPALPLPARARVILLSVFNALSNAAAEFVVRDVDQQDIASARHGDGEAFARIIRRHQPAIARRMLHFSRDQSVIEELVHDCFVEAYLSLPSYRADAPLEHWLAKIATRTGYRYWKSKRRDRERTLQLQSDASDRSLTALPANDSEEMAQFLLQQLSPRDRLAMTLLHIEGLSVAEAAEMAGWSQTMMKVQAFRARKKLRAILEKQGVDHG